MNKASLYKEFLGLKKKLLIQAFPPQTSLAQFPCIFHSNYLSPTQCIHTKLQKTTYSEWKWSQIVHDMQNVPTLEHTLSHAQAVLEAVLSQ